MKPPVVVRIVGVGAVEVGAFGSVGIEAYGDGEGVSVGGGSVGIGAFGTSIRAFGSEQLVPLELGLSMMELSLLKLSGL